MPKCPLKFVLRYKKLQFEKGVGRSIPKIVTELVTNSDDSYNRMGQISNFCESFGEIAIIANSRKRKISVIDQAEGMSTEQMIKKFTLYGEDSGDRAAGFRTRSLFGKGLRDALFTQKGAVVRSIKDNECAIAEFYIGRIKGSDQEDAIVDIDDHPPKVSDDLRRNWEIKCNGTLVEFRLRDDMRFPQKGLLPDKLSKFYMLRMINSNPSRHVLLKYIDSMGRVTIDQIKYVFPAAEQIKTGQIQMEFDGRTFNITFEVLRSSVDLAQGPAGYEDREGGLLLLDEDNNVMDLTLFRYDNDPAGSKLFGKAQIFGAGEYVRSKLNSKMPEAILSEDREGLVRSHSFYKKIAATMEEILKPIVEDEDKKRRSQETEFSPETIKRFSKAIDALNALYQQFVGKSDTSNGFTGITNPKLPEYLEFVRPELTIKEKVLTPIALLVNCERFPVGTEVIVSSSDQNITVKPARFLIERQSIDSSLQAKILHIIGTIAGITGNISAEALTQSAILKISVIDKDIFYPENGMEFNPANVGIHEEGKRKLHLFVNLLKIPISSTIEFSCASDIFELDAQSVKLDEQIKINDEVGCLGVTVSAKQGIGQKTEVKSSSGIYSSFASVEIVKGKEPEPPKEGGMFKPPKFDIIPNLKVQTWLARDGAILINMLDPLNATYFGTNPKETVEGQNAKLHCQIRLADLVLDECLNKIVTDAYGKGTIDRRYPNNPELDIRQYVAEWKFTYGSIVHRQFVNL